MERKYLKETLVTDVLLTNEKLGLELRCHDTVDFLMDLYIKEINIRNLKGKDRDVRLFFNQDLYIYENEVGDTAYFDPATQSVIHYKKSRWFLINTASTDIFGVQQWATGKKGFGNDGTWRDAEDGELGCNGIAQGSVDSTVRASVRVPADGSATAYYWMAFGMNYEQVAEINARVKEHTPAYFIPRNGNYWRLWVNPEHIDFLNLPHKTIDLFKRSLLTINTQTDAEGAIIAASDMDIAQFARDTYSYMWPRDGALVAYALSKAGYRDSSQRFFAFCAEVIKKEGYLLHKYNPDKSLASSWHPWIRNGKADLPIQEDETALVLWSLWHHFRKFRDVDFMKDMFERLLVAGANFLVEFRDPDTKLPLPSWDLWEERYGVHLFTVASVIGGLRAAASFSHAMGETKHQERFEDAANEVQAAMVAHMWNEKEKRFCRMATRTETGYELDMNVDAAMYGIFAFGALPANDPKVAATMKAIRDRLWVKTDVGGVARYENDYYHQVSQDIENVPGNPWFICTMWLAQYEIATARNQDDLREAVKILEWVTDHALPSGCLAEQVHPYTNEPLSVSPLTWSHATFVTCVLEYLEKRRVLMTEDVFAHTISSY
jgi:GH15 family glucan-1,4-alpha-glucosidase